MAEGNYKDRIIHDLSGNVLDDQAKETAYNLSAGLIDTLKKNDGVGVNLGAFLRANQAYIDNNLNLNKPFNEWTDNEVKEKIRAAKRDAKLGGLGYFEASDRVRNFRNRITLSIFMSEELKKFNEARNDAIVDTCISVAASDNKALQLKNSPFTEVALNWIPLLTRMKRENDPLFAENAAFLEPGKVLKSLNERKPDHFLYLQNMLQVIEDTNMEEFAYTDNETFSADFAKKYEKLKALAEGGAMIEYIKKNNNSKFRSRREEIEGNADSTKVIEAKSKMAAELLKDYECRMRLISSPYYTLLAGKDFEKLSDSKIEKLKGKNRDINTYLEDVIAYKQNRATTYRGANITDKLNTYITDIQPEPEPEFKLASDKTFDEIEKLIQKMYADTRRASSYTKVRTVLRSFIQAPNEFQKKALLNNVIFAAHTYLQERGKKSYKYRKERCEELIALQVKYNGEVEQESLAAEAREAEVLRQQQLREERENELQQKANEKHNALNWVNDIEGKLSAQADKNIKDTLERERKYREHKEFIDSTTKVIADYGELGKIGKTYKDSEAVRKSVLALLDKYVFKDDKNLDADHKRDAVDTIPTAMLVDALKANVQNIDEPDFAKRVKNDIRLRMWENGPANEKIRKPLVEKLNTKPEEITELDRLFIYEYSLHALDNIIEKKSLKYGTLSDMELRKFGALAVYSVDLYGAHPDLNNPDTFEKIPIQKRDTYIKDAATILSIFSGADMEIYKFLPIDDLSRYAYDALNLIQDPGKQKEHLDACMKQATEIKTRHELLYNAIDAVDKKLLIENIAKVTGKDQSDLQDIPTVDLVQLAVRMFDNVKHFDKMMNIYEEYKKVLLDRNEDYYREVFLNLETERRKGQLAPNNVLSRNEHATTYIKKVLGVDKLPDGSLDNLNDESLYTLVSNIGIIKYLNKSVDDINRAENTNLRVHDVLSHLSAEEYEMIGMNDKEYDKAVDAIKGLKLNKEFQSIITKVINPEAKKAAFFDNSNEINLDYAAKVSNPIGQVQPLVPPRKNANNEIKADAKKKDDAENQNKINEDYVEERWDEDTQRLLDLIGDLYNAAAKNPMVIEDVYRALYKKSSVIAGVINIINGKTKHNIFEELEKGLTEQERIFIEGAKPVLMDIATLCSNELEKDPQFKPKSFVRWKQIDSVLKNKKIELDMNKVSKSLNDAAAKGEQFIMKSMNEATSDAFDQVGGMGIPDIFGAEDNKNIDKEVLEYANNSLRYDEKRGQGKFLITLMNDYYKDSSPEDRRFMLSYIIKDFKKNTSNMTELQRGGNYFASSLKGAGPVMQKMMQGVPENIVIPELRNAINVVKSDLRPIEESKVLEVIKEIKDKSKDSTFNISIDGRLGAASVAETFLCTVTGKEIGTKEAVIKILRPDAKERMARELPLIQRSAIFADMPDEEVAKYKASIPNGKIPKHTPRATEAGFLAQLSEIEKEFDLKNEAQNCKIGMSKYGHKDTNVRSVELIKVPFGSNYLLMNKADGKTLDRHIKETRNIAEKALAPFEVKEGKVQKDKKTYKLTLDNVEKVTSSFEDLRHNMMESIVYGSHVSKVAKLWTAEALYGSAWSLINDYNFRHGDLHSGNIMVNKDYATILDYGNATSLHHEKVTEIMKMMSAVVLRRPDYFVEAFSTLMDMAIKEDKNSKSPIGYEEISPKLKETYMKRLAEIFETGTPENAGIQILLALTTAQSLGIKLPIELQNFSQCQQRLENSMVEIREAAIEARKSLDLLERMPLDDTLKNSCDPYAIFQRQMLKKNNTDKSKYLYQDSIHLAEKLMGDFNPKVVQGLLDDTNSLFKKGAFGQDIQEDVESFRKKYYDQYNNLLETSVNGEDVTLDTFPKITDEWRKIFKQFKAEVDPKTGKAPRELMMKFTRISGYIMTSANQSDLLSEYVDRDTIIELNRKATQFPFDEAAFETLMRICEVDLGIISDNCKALKTYFEPEPKDREKARQITKEGNDAIDAMKAYKLKKVAPVERFVDRIRSDKNRDAFENEMKRMFRDNIEFKKCYDNYRAAQAEYNKLTIESSKEEFIKARKNLINSENKLVIKYADSCYEAFKEIKKKRYCDYTMKDVLNTGNLPHYNDVIGKVMGDNRGSTLKRLGVKYSSELIDLEAKAEAEENKNKIIEEGAESSKAAPKKEEKKDSKKEVKKEDKKDAAKEDKKKQAEKKKLEEKKKQEEKKKLEEKKKKAVKKKGK